VSHDLIEIDRRQSIHIGGKKRGIANPQWGAQAASLQLSAACRQHFTT
jgi:hypothetical protein